MSRLELQLLCSQHIQTHTELHPHHNPISVPHWWCRLSFPAVICDKLEWQRSSTNDGALIKSASYTYFCTMVTMVTRGGDGWDLPRLAPCARSLRAHANQCQSMPVWIGRPIYHNRWTAVLSGHISHMGPVEKDGNCQAARQSMLIRKYFAFQFCILVWLVGLFLQLMCIWL